MLRADSGTVCRHPPVRLVRRFQCAGEGPCLFGAVQALGFHPHSEMRTAHVARDRDRGDRSQVFHADRAFTRTAVRSSRFIPSACRFR